MYKISIPISLQNQKFESCCDKYIKMCKKAGAERVFLISANWTSPESEKQQVLSLLIKYVPIFKAEGFEVGTWINSFGHGGTCGDAVNMDLEDGLTRMVSLDGNTNMGAYCPLCENQQALAKDWIKRLGQTGVSLIMMDDDYRYSFRNDEIFCACEKHQKLFTEKLGEKFDPKRMKEALTSGGPNNWRDTWLRVQGKTLTDFAGMLREALNEVNPNVKLSICSVLSTWDMDGADSITLAKTLAGDTKPFLRLIGAAYWAELRHFQEARLATVCEYERLQQYWCRNSGIEIFCEGDTYPRPRYKVPAAYLEGFDQVMRAAGTNDGILKYIFDYVSSPDYETGYLDAQLENQTLYDVIHEHLSDKKAVGVTIFEPMKTFALSHRPGKNLDNRCIPASIRFATDNSLPIQYDAGKNPTFIFGDAGEIAGQEQFMQGAILDITAAEALTRRGFDVGLVNVKGRFYPNMEEFISEEEVVGIVGGNWYEAEIADSAEVKSWQIADGKKVPAVYTYENTLGHKFAVYCFHAQESYDILHAHGLFRSWCRASQIRSLIPWLSGQKLEAMCDAAPDLYMMAKCNDDSMSVGLWNFSVDYIAKPVVHLKEEWSELICNWGNAKLTGTTVEVDRMPAFSFVCFTLKK